MSHIYPGNNMTVYNMTLLEICRTVRAQGHHFWFAAPEEDPENYIKDSTGNYVFDLNKTIPSSYTYKPER